MTLAFVAQTENSLRGQFDMESISNGFPGNTAELNQQNQLRIDRLAITHLNLRMERDTERRLARELLNVLLETLVSVELRCTRRDDEDRPEWSCIEPRVEMGPVPFWVG